MFKTLAIILISFLTTPLWAAEYESTDGTFDFICEQDDSDLQTSKIGSYNLLSFTMLIKKGAKIDIFSDDEFATGNGDIVYDINLTQLPFKDAEIVAKEMPLIGCQKSPVLSSTKIENGNSSAELYFECDGDGDAGFGTLNIVQEDMFDFKITGEINFPEGKDDILYPIKEDTQIKLTCQPNFG